MLLTGYDDVVEKFVASRIPGCERGFGECKTIGVVDKEGVLIGGVVYHNWNPESAVIEMSGASDSKRWLTKPNLHGIFAYPFDQLECQMVVMRCSEHNKMLLNILDRYGFDIERIERLRGRDEAEMICTLTDDKWRTGRFERKVFSLPKNEYQYATHHRV
jgi:RimJ/RimL family protein N-acetyltransferase